MTAHDYQMVMLGMLIADALLLSVWWVLGRSDRRADRRAADKAQAEAQAALDGIKAKVAAMEARR